MTHVEHVAMLGHSKDQHYAVDRARFIPLLIVLHLARRVED